MDDEKRKQVDGVLIKQYSRINILRVTLSSIPEKIFNDMLCLILGGQNGYFININYIFRNYFINFYSLGYFKHGDKLHYQEKITIVRIQVLENIKVRSK